MSSPIPPSEDALWTLPVGMVYPALSSSPQGLTTAEAVARLAQFGTNTIRETKTTPLTRKFIANFTHLMALLLWVGGAIAFVAQQPQLGIAIWLVNLINGVFSFWQEYRAEKATAALRRLLPHYAQVLREGLEERIVSDELVPGDVVILNEGDRISADGRLVEEAELRVDQSTLTGEAHPVRKTQDAVLRKDLTRVELPNLVFAGTNVAAGRGKAVVFATGMKTEFGQIANLTQSVGEDLSPLQKEMAYATKVVTVIAVGVGVIFFILATLLAGVNIADGLIFTLGMIVAFVPEGMLPTVTLALAMGTQRMARRNALIKKLSAVETLGCATVICTDKTGTLTENEMTVRELWVEGRRLFVSGAGYAPEGQVLEGTRGVSSDADAALGQLLAAAGLCNNARLLPPNGDSPRWTVLGDPTEAALLVAAGKCGLDLHEESMQMPRVRELPFDSKRKRMSTIHRPAHGAQKMGDGKLKENQDSPRMPPLTAYVKGAPKEILALSNCVRFNGTDLPLDERWRAEIIKANDDFARGGLRVLAIATRVLSPDAWEAPGMSSNPEAVERDLTFLGLVAMMDPPRAQVADAVEKCHRAGIRVVMITGDYGLTAESIARRIGILYSEQTRVITGVELDAMDDAALRSALTGEIIFARVAPEHKLRVVSALQATGQIVAVTGDGVNDAPALKKADIGIAMGIAGTDVAKEAADMILTDDNFASIVNAIEEGRAVYANIKKFICYIFTSNMPEAVPFILFALSQARIPLALNVMQILSIDLGTDMVPALALGAEAPEPGNMDHPPRDINEHVITRGLLLRAYPFLGLIQSVAVMAAFYFMFWTNGYWGQWLDLPSSGTLYQSATAMALGAVVATQIGNLFTQRTERVSFFRTNPFSNRLIWVGIATELALVVAIIYVPFLQQFFKTAAFPVVNWLFLFAWTPSLLLADELRKAWVRSHQRAQGSLAVG